MKTALAVIAAFIITGVLSSGTDHIFHITGIYPPYGEPMFETNLLLLASAYRIIFQIAGAYVMAIIAKENAMKAGWIVGVLGTILWIVGGFLMMDMGPIWYSLLGAILSIPTVMLGVKLYNSRNK